MARTVRDANLETRTARARLKARGKPYYRSIDTGLHLGYRKGRAGGKWVMRWYVGDQAYEVETIATADDTLDADGAAIMSFGDAQALARQLYVDRKRQRAGLSTKRGPYTVRGAIEDYLAWFDQNRKTGRDARWRAEALILPSLGNEECAKLTSEKLRKWRDDLATDSPRLRTKKGEAQQYRELVEGDDPDEAARRRRATVNRTLTILKAALNHAWRERKIGSDEPWRAVKPFKEADAARVRYLSLAECKRLINASDPTFRSLVHAGLLTGCRFSEIAAALVADFNPDSGTLHIRTSKSGKPRHVVLTDEGVTFFAGLCAGRSPRDRMLLKADGGRWLKSHQSRPMRDTCERAKIEPPAGFHILRHTYASHFIMNGGPLLVVAKNLGHSDTRMVEKHYGHLAPSYIADAVRAAAPKFGFKPDKKIAALKVPA